MMARASARSSLPLLLLTLVSCGPSGAPSDPPPVTNAGKGVVARVDGRPILASDLRAQMAGGQTRRQALAALVHLDLLAHEAYRRKLQHSAEVLETERRAMAALLARQVGEAITPAQIDRDLVQRAFKLNIDKFKRPETILVSHILCAVRDASSPEVKAGAERCRNAAIAYFAKHEPTLAQFEELAEQLRKVSGPATVIVERLTTARHGYTVRRFAKAAFETKQDTVSGPVRTHFGDHFIYRIKTNPALDKKLPEVEAKLREYVLPSARKIMFDRRLRQLEKRHGAQADPAAFLRALGDQR